MSSICVVDYGMGNLTSITNALRFLDHEVSLITEPEELSDYETIVLPGVGAFAKAMECLRQKKLDEALLEATYNGKKTIGICLGMELLFSRSFEFGEHSGLDLINGNVIPFGSQNGLQKTHMGWNNVESGNADFEKFNGDFYFVHSYYCVPEHEQEILFKTHYGIEFCSGVMKDNQIFGLQFHPEKSQKLGLDLLDKIIKDA